MMQILLLVAVGSAAGGMARYALSGAIAERGGISFPWGTLCVNVCGCLAIGLFFGWTGSGDLLIAAPPLHQLVTYGFLGGFTTFSTFSLETLNLVREGEWGRAVAYVTSTVSLGLLAVLVGYWLSV